jgi:SPP1 gp7 family putative phage head morphogenesis protein
MKNSEYWAKRFEDLEKSQNRKAEETYAQIERQYRLAQKELDSQIARWYQRFADNNDISLADAHKWIVGKDLAEFKWDVDEYIKYGKENAINQKWMRQLENASARVHISRLEALKLQTQQSMEKMFGNQLDTIDSAMKNIYTSGYYRTAFEIQKGVGVGWNFATLDENKISQVIDNPWAADGRNFSERIWGNREKLVNELNTTLTQNIMLGEDPQKAIDAIAKKMGVSKRNAGRLVMTEKAYFSSVSQSDAFRELDVEQYQVLATLDSHTSEICRDLDGKIYPMADYRAGDTAPPYHVYCRSTTVPYFDDDFNVPGERSARGEDGKTYYVPADMTYREWEKSFVEGGGKSGLSEIEPNDTIKTEEPVIEPEPVKELKPISDFRIPESKDYKRLIHRSQGAVPIEDKKQIHNHQKPDGSSGGYVATTNYITINSNLRGDGYIGKQLGDDDMKTIEALRTAITKYQLDDDFVMTRYVNGDYLSSVFNVKTKTWGKGELENIDDSITWMSNPYVVKEAIPNITRELQEHIGETINEKAFVSFSIIPNKNVMKDKSVKINILARKGTNCYIPNNRKESEGIFAEGSSFLLRDVQWDGTERKWILIMEIE